MRSRRGGSRGGIIYPPAMPSPESASPSSSPDISNPYSTFSGRHPDTCSGRGRAQLQGAHWMDTTVHTANFPLLPHPAPHTTQFLFHSTLHKPVITATVTITFSEETNLQEALPMNNGEQQRTAQWNRSAQDPGKQQMVEDFVTPHGEELVGSQPIAKGRAGDTKAIGGRAGDAFDQHAAEGSSAVLGIRPKSHID